VVARGGPGGTNSPGGRGFGGFGGGPAGGGPTWQTTGSRQRLGLRDLVPTSVQADNGAGLTKGIIGLCNKGQPRKAEDWGAVACVGLGRERRARLFRNRQGSGRKTSRHRRLVALRQSGARGDGLRPALRHRLHRFFRRRRRKVASPCLPVSLVENLTGSGGYHWMAGKLFEIRRTGSTPATCPWTRTN